MYSGGHRILSVTVAFFFLTTTRIANAWLLPRSIKTPTTHNNNIHRISSSTTQLKYRDNGHDEDEDSVQRSQASSSSSSSSKRLTIPVIGPIPGAMPLLVGGDMYLDPPTPMQWLTLEESIVAFQQQNSTTTHLPTVGATATIDASPLVAIMHDSSSSSTNSDGRAARYATLAAVVGMSSSSSRAATDVVDSMDPLANAAASANGQQLVPFASRIRLVGVGRAMLHDFYYRISLTDLDDVNEHDDDDDDGEKEEFRLQNEEDDEETLRKTPIIVASFDLLMDDGIRSPPTKASKHGVNSRFTSPVHALARMSSAANRLIRLHDDRRRLVRGLQAAKVRLEIVSSSSSSRSNEWFEEDDYDGLGLITSSSRSSDDDDDDDDDQEAQQLDIDDLLHNFPVAATITNHPSFLGLLSQSLLEKENYGLGCSASSLSSITALTKALMEKLEPYYTVEKMATEEFYYEALSFCAMHSLERYLTPNSSWSSEFWTWGLTCTNTVERLEKLHDYMWQHQQELQLLAQQASQDLRDCGEECTDLW